VPRKREIGSTDQIERSILTIRGQRVMLDDDLAIVYGVPTKRLNEQVRRNIRRFPSDFSFLLTREEFTNLKSQFATSSLGWGGKRKPPRAFTEHGAVMAASVLNTPVAVQASIEVVRAFVRLRQFLVGHAELARKVAELEAKYADHNKKIATVFEAIRQLMKPPEKAGRIGFAAPEKPAM